MGRWCPFVAVWFSLSPCPHVEFTHFGIMYSDLASLRKPFQTQPSLPEVEWTTLSFGPPLSQQCCHLIVELLFTCLSFLCRLEVPGGEAPLTYLCVYSPFASKQGLGSGVVKWKAQGASMLHHLTVLFLFQLLVKHVISHNSQITGVRWKWIWNDLSDLAPNYK